MLIRLNQPREVLKAAERYLTAHHSKSKQGDGMVLARYAHALAQTKEIPEAAVKLTEAVHLTRQHSSARLADEIYQARARLESWASTTYVRRLDETLRSCGLTPTGPGTRA